MPRHAPCHSASLQSRLPASAHPAAASRWLMYACGNRDPFHRRRDALLADELVVRMHAGDRP